MARASDPVQARAAAAQIVRRLRESGHTAYFNGGCVRDELLGLAPTDYDVATDAAPARVRELFPRTAEVGASFGVVLVKMDEAVVEVATFRSDGPYTDSRRPDVVHFSDPETDAKRRDFTINAMFLDPVAAADAPSIHGHVVDYVGGMADLSAKVIRAVGDADTRLAEDHLRALRAVRFAARLGFTIEPGTEAAIRRHTMELRGVSRERIGDELRRMMGHASRGNAIGLLQRLGLDAPVLEEAGCAPSLTTLDGLRAGPTYPACLAAWALDRYAQKGADKAVTPRWRKSLNLSNEETDALSDTLVGYSALGADGGGGGWLGLGVAQQKRQASRPWFGAALDLLSVRDPGVAAGIRKRVEALAASQGGLAPPPLVAGDDLVGMGLVPGPRFKTVLDGVYDAQLEGRVKDRAGAMELARRLGV